MKLKVRECIALHNTIANLDGGQKLAATTGFKLVSLLNSVKDTVLSYEQSRLKLCEKYGEEKNKPVPLLTEEHQTELFNVLDLEKDLNIMPMDMAEFTGLDLPFSLIQALEPVISNNVPATTNGRQTNKDEKKKLTKRSKDNA